MAGAVRRTILATGSLAKNTDGAARRTRDQGNSLLDRPAPSYKSQQCSLASCQDVQPPTGRRGQFCVHSLHNDVHRGEERVHWWRQVEGGIPTRSSPGIAWRRSPAATSENGWLGAVEGSCSRGRGATEEHGATGRPRSSRCSRVAAWGQRTTLPMWSTPPFRGSSAAPATA
jgi:hypothetical protein